MRQMILACATVLFLSSPMEVDFKLEIPAGTKLAKFMTHQASYELISAAVEVSGNEMPIEMSMAFEHRHHIVYEDSYGEFDQRGPREITRELSSVEDKVKGEVIPFIGDKQEIDLALETLLAERPVRWIRTEAGEYAPRLLGSSPESDPEWLDGLIYDGDGRELLPPEGTDPKDGWQVSPSALVGVLSQGGDPAAYQHQLDELNFGSWMGRSIALVPLIGTAEVKGQVHLQLGEVFEGGLAEIELKAELELVSDSTPILEKLSDKVPAEEKQDLESCTVVSDLKLTGRLVWNIQQGRWESMDVECGFQHQVAARISQGPGMTMKLGLDGQAKWSNRIQEAP